MVQLAVFMGLGGALSAVRVQCTRSARTVQLFGCLAVVETHTLWYFGHHCCLVVGFDALGICIESGEWAMQDGVHLLCHPKFRLAT